MKGAWFLSREGGIFRRKIFCIIGPYALHYEWKYMLNEKILINGFLSSNKKEIEVGYGKASGDDDNTTQGTSPHPLVRVNAFRFFSKTFG